MLHEREARAAFRRCPAPQGVHPCAKYTYACTPLCWLKPVCELCQHRVSPCEFVGAPPTLNIFRHPSAEAQHFKHMFCSTCATSAMHQNHIIPPCRWPNTTGSAPPSRSRSHRGLGRRPGRLDVQVQCIIRPSRVKNFGACS